jgi:hypothetical protein
MTSIPEAAETIWRVLQDEATAVERATGFVQRQSKVTGAVFVQTLVLGWLGNPAATLNQLAQMAARLGVTVTPQGLHDRFTSSATLLLEEVLAAAVAQVVQADPVAVPILARFSAVTVQDSTPIVLPAAWADLWPGCGGTNGFGVATLKCQVRWDLLGGRLEGPFLEAGRAADQRSSIQHLPVPPGALRLADLGYFSLPVLAEVGRQGSYWLSRWQRPTVIFTAAGERLDDLPRWLAARRQAQTLDCPVTLGVAERLPARLLVVRVPRAVAIQRRERLTAEARRTGKPVSPTLWRLARWTIWVTNAPAELLSVADAQVLARARWQVELLFKLWKQHGLLDDWRSEHPDRILCEVYAKLIGCLLQHWIALVTCWDFPDRSLVKVGQAIRASAVLLATALAGAVSLSFVLRQIRQCVPAACRLNSRRRSPNTYQLLLARPASSLA